MCLKEIFAIGIAVGLSATVVNAQQDSAPPPSRIIKIRGDVWCPYNCAPESTERPGYMIEVFKKIFEARGYLVDYQLLNWSRSVKEAREGQWDAIVGAAKSDAPDFIYSKNALGVNETCFFTKVNETWTYKGKKTLDSRVLGAVQDYGYDDKDFSDYLKQNQKNEKRLQLVNGDDALTKNMDKLEYGRIDTLVDNDFVVIESLSKRTDGLKLRKAGCIKKEKLYIAFSPQKAESKNWAKILSDGVAQMRKDGSLSQILKKYELPEFK